MPRLGLRIRPYRCSSSVPANSNDRARPRRDLRDRFSSTPRRCEGWPSCRPSSLPPQCIAGRRPATSPPGGNNVRARPPGDRRSNGADSLRDRVGLPPLLSDNVLNPHISAHLRASADLANSSAHCPPQSCPQGKDAGTPRHRRGSGVFPPDNGPQLQHIPGSTHRCLAPANSSARERLRDAHLGKPQDSDASVDFARCRACMRRRSSPGGGAPRALLPVALGRLRRPAV